MPIKTYSALQAYQKRSGAYHRDDAIGGRLVEVGSVQDVIDEFSHMIEEMYEAHAASSAKLGAAMALNDAEIYVAARERIDEVMSELEN